MEETDQAFLLEEQCVWTVYVRDPCMAEMKHWVPYKKFIDNEQQNK